MEKNHSHTHTSHTHEHIHASSHAHKDVHAHAHAHEKTAKHVHPHELAKKLQEEVNFIMSNVDEKTMFAEFRKEEVFDIQNGDKHETVTHTLDDRILLNRPIHPTKLERIETTTKFVAKTASKKIGTFTRLIHYLFKPLQF
jgi:hypothetical protein